MYYAFGIIDTIRH